MTRSEAGVSRAERGRLGFLPFHHVCLASCDLPLLQCCGRRAWDHWTAAPGCDHAMGCAERSGGATPLRVVDRGEMQISDRESGTGKGMHEALNTASTARARCSESSGAGRRGRPPVLSMGRAQGETGYPAKRASALGADYNYSLAAPGGVPGHTWHPEHTPYLDTWGEPARASRARSCPGYP